MAYDVVLIDPSSTVFRSNLGNAAYVANYKARERTVGDAHVQDAITYYTMDDDLQAWSCDVGGWGVPNSYRQRAFTSLLGVAWFTDQHNRRHVRIYGARLPAKKSPFGHKRLHAFTSDDEAICVYPCLQPPHLLQYERKGKWALPPLLVALIDAVAENPLCGASRAALIDWHTEHGNHTEASQQRKALETIALIARPPVCATV